MSTSAHDAYRTNAILSADPVTLTSMLFDGAVKAIRRARMHAEAGKRDRSGEEIEKAFLIIGELLSTLDLNQGEIAQNLSSVYVYCLQELAKAAAGDIPALDEVELHITRIGQAWKTATVTLRPDSGAKLSSGGAAA
jgi:flagellar protein FliS